MKNILPKISTLISFLFTSVFSFAQGVNNDIEMADELRSSGKIYIVVAVLAIIFVGIVSYLISIDRKVSRMEKKNKL